MFGMYLRRITAFLFHDPVCQIEVLSALNLLSWTWLFLRHPEVLVRDSYTAFQSLPAHIWVVGFIMIAAVQIAGMALRGPGRRECRFFGMALAAGCWAMITGGFFTSPANTADAANYLWLTLLTMIAGGFLGWKTSSTR